VTQRIERDAIYRRRRFPRDVIETRVRWYLTYRLSYRDLVSLMAERHAHVTHTTIMRWVFQFVREYERRWNRRVRPVGSSWRVDETYIRTGPRWATCIVPLIRRARQWTSCSRRGAVLHDSREKLRWIDTNPVIWICADFVREDQRWKYVLVRKSQYLKNVVEQEHRAIKGRCRCMLSFKSYSTAAKSCGPIRATSRQCALGTSLMAPKASSPGRRRRCSASYMVSIGALPESWPSHPTGCAISKAVRRGAGGSMKKCCP
jgi:transposase-like protein